MSGPQVCKFFPSGRRRQAWHVGIEVIVLSHFIRQANVGSLPSTGLSVPGLLRPGPLSP